MAHKTHATQSEAEICLGHTPSTRRETCPPRQAHTDTAPVTRSGLRATMLRTRYTCWRLRRQNGSRHTASAPRPQGRSARARKSHTGTSPNLRHAPQSLLHTGTPPRPSGQSGCAPSLQDTACTAVPSLQRRWCSDMLTRGKRRSRLFRAVKNSSRQHRPHIQRIRRRLWRLRRCRRDTERRRMN